MEIAGKKIGEGHPCFIVGEVGINHNGSLDTARQLIDVAVDAGCDAVKFQKRTIDVVYTPEELARPRKSPFGETNGDLKRGLEFDFDDYCVIDGYCRKKGIKWLASPWDIKSVDFLEGFLTPAYKIASPCLTNVDLLIKLSNTEKPMIISTGMSSQHQISEAIDFLGDCDVALMVCTSTYPAKLEDLNLSRILTMRHEYADPIGYSNHHPGIYASLCAVALGASILEVHITLDRSSWGSDQSASIEPQGLKKLVKEIRDYEIAKGDGKIRMLDSEIAVMQKLRRVK